MKKLQHSFKGWARLVLMGSMVTLGLSSCIKDNNNYAPVQQPVALISAINASVDAQNVDLFLDQNRTGNVSIKNGNSQDYIRAFTGKRNITFYVGGTTQKIVTDTATLKTNTFYSAFLSNLSSKPDLLLLTDTIKQPAVNTITVRFVNLSPDAPAADLAIKGGNVLVSNKAYKGYSGFVAVPYNSVLNFEIRQAGTATVLASLPNQSLRNGSIYTIWIQGLAAATDQTKLSAHIQNNVYYY